jgi:hypothetical protein
VHALAHDHRRFYVHATSSPTREAETTGLG